MSNWVFPELHPGDTVLFGSGPSANEWSVATILAVGHDHISCAVFEDRSANEARAAHQLFSGVRHAKDPWLNEPQHREAVETDEYMGIFKTTERHDRLRDLELRLTALEKASEPKASSTPRRTKKKAVKDGEAVATG